MNVTVYPSVHYITAVRLLEYRFATNNGAKEKKKQVQGQCLNNIEEKEKRDRAILFLMRSLTFVSLTKQPFNVRREQRVRKEEHMSAIIQTSVNLIISRIREKYKRHEGVPHENESIKLQKDPSEYTCFPSCFQERLHFLAVL